MKTTALCGGAILALAACGTDHRFDVETAVAADGAVTRVLSFPIPSAEEPDSTWRVFSRPQDPYRVEADGGVFRAEADLSAGAHPGGIRPVLPAAEEGGAPRCAEGDFRVEALDLVVGRRFGYRETVENGVDFEVARAGLDRWLRRGIDLAFEALRRRFPEDDLGRLEAHVRESLLPRCEGVVEETYLQFLGWWRSWRDLEVDPFKDAEHAERFWRLVETSFARLGLAYTRPPGSPPDPDDLFEEGRVDASEFAAREIRPHLEELPPGRIAEILALFETEALEAFAESIESIHEEWYPPGEERARLEREGMRDLVSAVGFPVVQFFDTYRVEMTLRLPGRIVRTNGDLTAAPGEVRWVLRDVDFWFVPSRLHATAFEPEPWARLDAEGKERAWDAETVRRLAEALEGVSEEERGVVGHLLRTVVDPGAEAAAPDLEAGLGELGRRALHRLRAILLGEARDE